MRFQFLTRPDGATKLKQSHLGHYEELRSATEAAVLLNHRWGPTVDPVLCVTQINNNGNSYWLGPDELRPSDERAERAVRRLRLHDRQRKNPEEN